MATEVTEPQPSTSAAADKPEDTKEVQDAFNLLAQGKRNMLCGEVPKAVQQLEEACRLLAEKYGEVSDQCGDAYLAYGSALLDLSRMESGVLGNALKGIESGSEEDSEASDDKVEDPEKVSEKEKEEIGDQVIDAMLETDEEQKARMEKEKPDGDKSTDKPEEKEKDKKTEDKPEEKEKDEKTEDKPKEKDEKTEDKPKEKEEKTEDKPKEKEEKTEDKPKEKEEKTEDKSKEKDDKEKKAEEKMDVDDEAKKEKSDTEKTEEETKDEKTKEEKESDEKESKDAGKKDEEAMDTEEKKDEEGEEAEGEGEEGEEGEESEALETEEEKEEAEGEEGGEDEEKKSNTSQEDVSNLQLAWEMLELAKVIYSRHEDKDMKLKAAEAHLKLGEVGLETEQYETAIADFKSCLKIQQNFLEAESRLIAETHYQIGLACTLACRYTEALDNYRLAVKTIECKIAKLKAQIEESEKSGKHKEAGSFDENAIIAEKEIKDLSEILPDIRAKIEDTEDEMKSQDKVKELVKESVAADMGTSTGFGGETSSASPSKAAAEPAKDISHMIRKKRKPEDEPEDDEAAKKARQEEKKPEPVEDKKAGGDGPVANGTADHTNGTNGTTSPEKTEEIKTKTVEDVKKAAEEATA